MTTRPVSPWLIGLLLMVIVIAGSLMYFLPSVASQDAPCPADWKFRSPEEKTRCLMLKPTFVAQHDEAALQTGIALATANPQPTSIGPVKLWLPDWDSTGIKEIDLSLPDGGGPVGVQSINSLWDNGNIPTQDYYWWNPLKVYTKPMKEGQPALLGTYVLGGGQNERKLYNNQWPVPEELGTIKITGISGIPVVVTPGVFPGPPNLIQVASEAGKTGVFDLVTQQWLINP